MVYPRNAPLRTVPSNARLAVMEGGSISTSEGEVLGDDANGRKSDYAQPKRPQHSPYRHPSQPRDTKEPRLTDTHWGLFDRFMERNAPKEYRK